MIVPARREPRTGSRLGPALLWSYALSAGEFGVGGLLTFVLAALLDPGTFGIMVMAMVWISFVLMLVHHATLPIVQQPGLDDRHFSAGFWAMLGGASVIAVLLFAAGPAVAALNRTPDLTDVLRVLAPLVLIEASSAIPSAVLRRRMRFRALAIRGLVAIVAGGAVGVGMALSGYGVWALVGQQYAASVTSAVVLWLARPWRLRLGSVRAEVREMRDTALKSVGGYFGYFVSLRTDTLVMGVLFGPVAVGLYRLASRVTEMIRSLAGTALSQVSLPDLAALHAEPERFVRRLSRFVHVSAVTAFPLFGLAAAIAEPALALLGPEWVDAAAPLRVLCLAGAVWVIYSQLCTGLMAAQRPGTEALFNWLRAAVIAGTLGVAAVLSWTAPLATRVVAIALSVLAMEAVMLVVTWRVTFRRVLRTSGRPVLAAMAPSAGAGLAALAAGWTVVSVVPATAPVPALGLGLAAGIAVAVPLLLATDPLVTQGVRTLWARLRARTSATVSEGP